MKQYICKEGGNQFEEHTYFNKPNSFSRSNSIGVYFIPRKYEDFEVGLTTIISPLGTVALIDGLLIPILLFRKNSLDYFNIKKHKLKLILIILIAIAWYFKDFLLT